jgi:hypothetical protein
MTDDRKSKLSGAFIGQFNLFDTFLLLSLHTMIAATNWAGVICWGGSTKCVSLPRLYCEYSLFNALRIVYLP